MNDYDYETLLDWRKYSSAAADAFIARARAYEKLVADLCSHGRHRLECCQVSIPKRRDDRPPHHNCRCK